MAHSTRGNYKLFIMLLSLLALGGCATTQGPGGDTNDPLEPGNRFFYGVNETLDGAFVKPLAEFYVYATPEPVRESVNNLFGNLGYINVILNSFLQGKADDGWSDTARFLVNSTLGIGGLFDVATDMGLPSRQEDFGQTLAVWGSGEGAYMYLPIWGPTTVRDAPGIAVSTVTNPLFYLTGAALYPVTALGIINTRANVLEATRLRDEAALDAYVFTREAYLQRRNYLIFDGNPPADGYDDIFNFDSGEGNGDMLRVQ
ncbi:MAG: VacJ family lipoprotein [Gammaproteobacteria bacterium]